MSINTFVVMTIYGKDDEFDKLSFKTFSDQSEAEKYCGTINDLAENGDSWVRARVIKEEKTYSKYLLRKMEWKFDLLADLDDMSIQRVIREVDSHELAEALKGKNDDFKDKIFKNLTEKAAQILKEDMEYMGPIPKAIVKKAQEKIVKIMEQLEIEGTIIFYYNEDYVA